MRTFKEVLKNLPKERQERIQKGTENLILELELAAIREELALSQKELATSLGISQPAVAQIEQRGNEIKLATLKRYIESMGGKLSLTITLPSGSQKTFGI